MSRARSPVGLALNLWDRMTSWAEAVEIARAADQAGFDLVAHTSSGEVRSDLPITVQGSLGHGELRGKVRGGGVRVEVSTGSGDIHIVKISADKAYFVGTINQP